MLVFIVKTLGATFLGLRPQAFLLEVLLPGQSFLPRVLVNEPLSVVNINHVILLFDLFLCLLCHLPVLESCLLQAEVLDGRLLPLLHVIGHAKVIVRGHLSAILVA